MPPLPNSNPHSLTTEPSANPTEDTKKCTQATFEEMTLPEMHSVLKQYEV